MHPRVALNFAYVQVRPSGDGVSDEDREKFDAELYAPLEGEFRLFSLTDHQIGG